MADKMQNGLKAAAHDTSRGVSGIKSLQLGVWKVLLYQDLPSMEARWSRFRSSFDVLCSLVMDIFSLGPKPFISLVLAKTVLALKPSLFLYQSNQILNIVGQYTVLSTECQIYVFRLNRDTTRDVWTLA